MTPGANVAEIRAGGRGSGLLVGPGVVLTALHVVFGEDRPAAIGDDVRVQVRLRRDVVQAEHTNRSDWGPNLAQMAGDPALRWRDARLIWPRAGADPYAHDVALIQIENWDTAQASPAEGEMRLGRLDRSRACIAYGFPAFYTESEDERTLYRCFLAEARVRGDEIPDPGCLNKPLRVDNGSPKEPAGWVGMSGAVMMLDDRTYRQIVGVVQASATGIHDNSRLAYWPLTAIPADDEFWSLAGIDRSGPRPAARRQPAQPPAIALREHFYEFDRTLQSSTLRRWLNGDAVGAAPRYERIGPPVRPSAIVVRSHVIDEPDLCLARFADLIATLAFKRNGHNYRNPVPLRCGPYTIPAEDRIDRILLEWAERYSAEPPLGADLEQIIVDGLQAPDRPRLIVLQHDADRFVEGCSQVADRVLQIIAKTAQTASSAEAPPIVILCLITGIQAGPPDTAFLPAALFPEKQTRFAIEIEAIRARHPEIDWCTGISDLDAELASAEDFDTWLRAMAGSGLPVPAGLGEAFRANLHNVDRFRMRYAKAAADLTLAQTGSQP